MSPQSQCRHPNKVEILKIKQAHCSSAAFSTRQSRWDQIRDELDCIDGREKERWREGEMERWREGEMDRWGEGEMDRWIDGEMGSQRNGMRDGRHGNRGRTAKVQI
jgi:hypothetical protein